MKIILGVNIAYSPVYCGVVYGVLMLSAASKVLGASSYDSDPIELQIFGFLCLVSLILAPWGLIMVLLSFCYDDKPKSDAKYRDIETKNLPSLSSILKKHKEEPKYRE